MMFLNFQTARVAINISRIISVIGCIWCKKYARLFVLGHCLFLKAHIFPRASKHIFARNGSFCLFILRQVLILRIKQQREDVANADLCIMMQNVAGQS